MRVTDFWDNSFLALSEQEGIAYYIDTIVTSKRFDKGMDRIFSYDANHIKMVSEWQSVKYSSEHYVQVLFKRMEDST